MKTILTMRMMVACVAVLVATTGQVQAGVITFNGTAPEADSVFAGGTTHSEAGFSLQITGISYFVDNSVLLFPGVAPFDDDVLEFNGNDARFVMTQDNGNLFNLDSVETGSLGFGNDGNFLFTGTFGGGGTISQEVQGIGPSKATFNFSGFTGLSSVSVTTSDGFFPVMDNLTFSQVSSSQVPEPTSLAIFGTICLIGFGRRKA